ncbi:hypothetical protein HYFRA_00004019 [Hymenoscyphus fraxineus]|uniref:Alpha/beta-hydrolase n=1 Tax=Hymenoscyphus fraxineus TaxID=746836 RepID=A0A9N9PKB9_9HELO|nr:hypothetical protein HYFRA_00004019 [Hymenoscyphus fraxineus]
MLLPPPTLSFTIPSIHDDLILDCRVYHPICLAPTKISQVEEWHKKAAIIAHPYAPLGGSYDDPIVERLAAIILKQGFCVGTFNFRGAGNSRGKTSWQSKAEQKDYISFIGFMAHYIHDLSPPPISPSPTEQPRFTRSDSALHDLTPVPSQTVPPPHDSDDRLLSPITAEKFPSTMQKDLDTNKTRPRLLLAGYSYGAMVTCSLPALLSSILEPFQSPEPGTAHAEIRLRAQNLAAQQNKYIHAQISEVLYAARHSRGRSLQIDDIFSAPTSPRSRRTSGGVRIGGDEDFRRASHDSFRSRSSFSLDTQERVRKSIDRVRSLTKSPRFPHPQRTTSSGSWASFKSYTSNTSINRNFSKSDQKLPEEVVIDIKAVPEILDEFQTAYILISPLRGLINSLATMWTYKPTKVLPEPEMKFTVDPTLALFGDDDIFVSAKRLRSWARKLECMGEENKRDSLVFRYREVKGAGHFWHDHEALEVLKEEVRDFVVGL